MNPGVCIRPYTPHGYLAPIPNPLAYHDLHDLGIRTIRFGAPVIEGARPPATVDDSWQFDFSLLMQWLLPVAGAAGGNGGPQTPWMWVYVNPGGCPPSASENQPAYVDELGVSRWPPGSPETDDTYCGGGWWDDRTNPGLGVHDFNQDPHRTDSVTRADGKILTGPELAAIDAKMPARPYLLNPPHRDPQYAFDLGRQLMLQHGWLIHEIGPENEPGGGLLARQEKRIGGDMMRDRMFPEIYVPFAAGVRSVGPNFNKPDLLKLPKIVGCEADSADILARYLDADEERYRGRPSLSVCDKISIHPARPSYATMDEFSRVLKGRQSYREVSIGEVDVSSDPEELYAFTVEVVAKSGKEWPVISDIIYLAPSMFYEPGSSWTTLGPWDSKKSVLSAVGLKFQKLFAKMNNARRSA